MMRRLTVKAPAAAGIVLAALSESAWAQGVQLGGGAGAGAFSNWILGPNALGAIIAILVALVGLTIMGGRHSGEGILYSVLGGVIAGSAVTIAGYFA